MKKVTIFLFILLIATRISGQICSPQLYTAQSNGQCNPNPYILVFEDNFDGDSLDLSKWQIQPWAQGTLEGDNSQQYYSLDNVSLVSGICSIIAKRDTVTRRAVSWLPDDAILSDSLPNLRTYYFTSSNLWTNQQFGYGMFEIRCRIPSGKGFWPAFWMYGSNTGINREIDVFEFWDNDPAKLHMTVHFNGQMCGSDLPGPDYSAAFHTFKVIWDPYKIDWYVDSVLKKRVTKFHDNLGHTLDCDDIEANNMYILEKVFPDDSLHIITNVAIQTGPFAPDSATIFPSSLDIDYIRYYKQDPVTGIEIGQDSQHSSSNIANIQIYPNPSAGILNIDLGKADLNHLQVNLEDLQGNIIYQSSSLKNKVITIDIHGLSKGIYFIHIGHDKTHDEFIRKLIFN